MVLRYLRGCHSTQMLITKSLLFILLKVIINGIKKITDSTSTTFRQ